VLADGRVVTASAKENQDLFKVLKGGGNNFGIVTRFDMRTFAAPAGGLWGGLMFLSYDHKQTVLRQFVRLIDINSDNRADTQALTLTYNSPGPARIATVIVNTQGVENSTSFAPIVNLPTLIKDVRRRTYGNLITTFVTTGGDR
jgi:FAD/FMN-containing dehydrogenase